MPTTPILEIPLFITVLFCCTVVLLAIILILLFNITGKLSVLTVKLQKNNRSTKLTETDAEPNVAEVGPGTPFEEFLNEEPQRRSLSKNEQFKAYRKWRAEKGLNYSAGTPPVSTKTDSESA